MCLLGLSGCRPTEQDGQQHHDDQEDRDVPDDADVSPLHASEHHTAQTGEREHSARDHEASDPCGEPATAEDGGGEQNREREKDVPGEDVESVYDRRPLKRHEERQPRLVREFGLPAQGQDDEVQAAGDPGQHAHEDH